MVVGHADGDAPRCPFCNCSTVHETPVGDFCAQCSHEVSRR